MDMLSPDHLPSMHHQPETGFGRPLPGVPCVDDATAPVKPGGPVRPGTAGIVVIVVVVFATAATMALLGLPP
ncbi:hypothetical protein AB0K09_32470, partial [Streptomyces sp. NPDC049577]|uniref:hypothetical protein n=1 Tax=Streptomyces sp. NPDC049577 TaxID=3155153 RepID=UPI00343EEA38